MRNKIIVGVHGIGDQVRYETIQAIAYQFCRFYNIPSAVPLGKFHSDIDTHDCLSLKTEKPDITFGFTEVYWADIARKPEREGYTLEETKKWAKTIVEGLRGKHKDSSLRPEDYRMIKSVLYEMIDAVDILERLLFITEKTGLFKFDLNRILTGFLGDVQIVTEFKGYRDDILERFFSAMNKVYEKHGQADIYVIAHSEGTVISFLGLLTALKGDRTGCEWIKNVKGFVTLGSPIDKHLLLWPELWDPLAGPRRHLPDRQIKWRNYYDYGDPVGYELNTAKGWLDKHSCAVFDFENSEKREHDIGFARYYLPGKAHVEYWNDNELFDHIIHEVIEGPASESASPTACQKPGNKFWARLFSYIFPYATIYALMFLAVYFLYKPVSNCLSMELNYDAWTVLKNVGGIASILAGMTVMARVPRMTRRTKWHLISFGMFSLSALAYSGLVAEKVQKIISRPVIACPAFEQAITAVSAATHIMPEVVSVLIPLSVIAIVVSWLSGRYSSLRTRPLIIMGGAFVLGIVAWLIHEDLGHSSIWPVFVGSALFLYIWWLAILLFDMVFVWHRYIRHSRVMSRLREMRRKDED